MTRGAELKVAVVGAGLMGRWHATYAVKAGAAITAIVDQDERKATALRASYPRAQIFSELGECLARCDVDVAHICTPPSNHAPLTTLALTSGTHVLVEKPLAPSVVDTERLIELARRTGLLLNPTHQFPFQRGVQTLIRHLDRLGEPVRLAFVTCTSGGAGLDPTGRRALLLDILPHPLALFRAVMRSEIGEIAWDLAALTDDELELRGSMRGIKVHALLSLRGRPTRNGLTVMGTEGTAHADLFHGYSLIERGRPTRRAKLIQPFAYGGKVMFAAGGNLLERAMAREPAYPGLAELIAQFHRAVTLGEPAPIGSVEMIDVAAVIDLIRGAPTRPATFES